MSRAIRSAAVVEYPYSDGRPLAESEAQLRAMLYLVGALYGHFRGRPDVYVGADMFLYYEEGNPAAVVAPDVFVVMGAPKRSEAPRLSYKLWEEPKGPDFVLEVASRSTWPADRDRKRALYASLGVEEYWLYDPTGERIRSRMRGMHLAGGGYRDIAPFVSGLGVRKLRSAVLGLDVGVGRAGAIRLHDPETGEALASHAEERAAREAAEDRAVEEAEARRAAEAQARQESAARKVAEARVAELEALLRTSGDPHPQGVQTPPRHG